MSTETRTWSELPKGGAEDTLQMSGFDDKKRSRVEGSWFALSGILVIKSTIWDNSWDIEKGKHIKQNETLLNKNNQWLQVTWWAKLEQTFCSSNCSFLVYLAFSISPVTKLPLTFVMSPPFFPQWWTTLQRNYQHTMKMGSCKIFNLKISRPKQHSY